MVSSLDSFLQFIAAICFTITIDSSVFQRFWNADYYGIIKKCLSKYEVKTSTPKAKELDLYIEKHKRVIEASGRMQGAYLLLVSCILIVYELFESIFVECESVHNIAISIVLLFSFIVVTFTNWLNKWEKVILLWGITIILLITLTIVSVLYSSEIEPYVDLILSRILLRILLVLSVGIPVGCRFLYNWLYTNRYPIFLDASLFEEKKEFEAAKKAIKEKDKNGLPEKYQGAFRDAYMDEMKNASEEEDVVASCTDLYYNQIESIVDRQPTFFQLFKRTKKDVCSELLMISSPIPQLKEFDKNEMQRYVEEYYKLTARPKMKDFCCQKGIDYVKFSDLWNKKIRKNGV